MNDLPPFDGVLFDMDGTLIDTVPHIVDTFHHTFRKFRITSVSEEAILASVGTPLETFLSSVSDGDVRSMIDVYREHNERLMDQSIGIFLGIPEMLAGLRRLGVAVGVVTAKLRASADKTLGVFGLEDCFDVIIVKEDTTRHKPDPEPLQLAMSRLNLPDPGRVLFVGDSVHDIRSAHAAGCAACAVGWTRMPYADLRAEAPHFWAERPADIVALAGGEA